MSALQKIEGIGEAYEVKLKAAGVTSVENLLEKCTTKKGRKELAEAADVSEKLVLKWANHADLARIKGIGGQYSELLEASGVDTVPELATRNPENLFAKMSEVNDEKNLVRKLPTEKQVQEWVLQAKELPRVLQY